MQCHMVIEYFLSLGFGTHVGSNFASEVSKKLEDLDKKDCFGAF